MDFEPANIGRESTPLKVHAAVTHVVVERQQTEVDVGPCLVDVVSPVCQELAGESRCLAADQRRTDAVDEVLGSAEDPGSHLGRRPTTLTSPTVSYWHDAHIHNALQEGTTYK